MPKTIAQRNKASREEQEDPPLFLDKEGRWFHEGEEITHARTCLLFSRSLRRDPTGSYYVSVGDESSRVELIVLITPHIIETPSQAEGAQRLEDVQRLATNARSNLYWMSRAKIDEDRYARAVRYYMDGKYGCALAEINNDFTFHRNYLERIRLKERILRETQPEQYKQLERIMLQQIEKEESGKWFRW